MKLKVYMNVFKWLISISAIFATTTAFAGTIQDIINIMRAFQSNIWPLYHFVVAIAYVMGIWFVLDAIFKLKKYGQARTMMSANASLAKPIILLFLGLGLLYFPTFVSISIQSIWVSSTSDSVLRYPLETSILDVIIRPLIDSIRLFGLIAIIRGIVILTSLANESTQPGRTGKGIMHIIAGTMAVNIVGTLDIIKATFGFS
jgi:intracellular multiplication protein IcmC